MCLTKCFIGILGLTVGTDAVSGMPVLFGFIMYTGGPTSAFTNWTMVGGLSVVVSLVMAEIAAALPTAGGIYFWSYRLGGEKWGPFLSWLTAVRCYFDREDPHVARAYVGLTSD